MTPEDTSETVEFVAAEATVGLEQAQLLLEQIPAVMLARETLRLYGLLAAAAVIAHDVKEGIPLAHSTEDCMLMAFQAANNSEWASVIHGHFAAMNEHLIELLGEQA